MSINIMWYLRRFLNVNQKQNINRENKEIDDRTRCDRFGMGRKVGNLRFMLKQTDVSSIFQNGKGAVHPGYTLLLWNQKLHQCFHQSSIYDSILIQYTPVHNQ